MKEIFLALLFLFPYSIYSYNVQQVLIDSSYVTYLDTYNYNNYFYIRTGWKNYEFSIYFYLFDTSYELNRYEYCLTTNSPNYDTTIDNCDFISLNFYRFHKKDNTNQYYFKKNIKNYVYNQYLIVKYSGSNSRGTLTAKSSYSDLYYESNSTTGFSTLTIVFIVIAAVAFIGIIITIVCYFCRKKNVANAPYVPNEPITIIPNTNEPLTSENNLINS